MTTEKPFRDLWEFHEVYDCARSATPNLPDDKAVRDLRIALLREEWEEYLKAEAEDDFVEIADALADIVYIAYGTAVAYGIPMDKVFNTVHASNMSKLDENGQPIRRADNKILKGPNYWEPKTRIKELLAPTINARPEPIGLPNVSTLDDLKHFDERMAARRPK